MARYLLSVVTAFLLVGCAKEAAIPPPIRPVRAMRLQEEQRVELYAFPGRTRAVGRANLSFRVEGPLIERPVNVGDAVKKGDLLAKIDPRDFEVNVQNAQGKLERAEAQLRFAERDYQRAVNIWKEDPGAISESLLDQKKEEVNTLKGEVHSLEADLAAAQDQLSYAELRAPYDGMVVATYVENYEYVKAKQPIIRQLNAEQVEMVIDVPENLIANMGQVDRIEVEFDNYPGERFFAQIKEIGTEASAITRTFPVTLVLDQPGDLLLLAGMAGHAYLYGPKLSQEGFLLPTSALFTDTKGRKTFAWVVEKGRVRREQVVKGALTAGGILVTEGLQAGQWVVTSGVHALHDGEEVKVIPVTLNQQGEQVEHAGDDQVGS